MKPPPDFSGTIRDLSLLASTVYPDALLIAKCQEFLALDEGCGHPADRLATPEELGQAPYELLCDIARSTPKTALGRRFLADVAIRIMPCGEPEWRIVHVLLATVARDGGQ